MIIEEMTMGEFVEGLKFTRTVYIPFGSIEEHGNHLPLSTDTIQAYELGKKASRIIPLFVAPPVHYGLCRSTSSHPGTISISSATLKGLLKDIIRSFHSQGLNNFLVLTGHAGGTHCMALLDAGEEILKELPNIKIALVKELDLVRESGRSIIATSDDAHAGEIETSRIMHSHPQLVKGKGQEEYPHFPAFILVRNKMKFWPGGVWGNPTNASPEKGRLLEEFVVQKIVDLAKSLEDFCEGKE